MPNLKGYFNKLTELQKTRMYIFIREYPEFYEDGEIVLTTPQLGRLWKCRADNVLYYLRNICKRLDDVIQYELLYFAKEVGKSEGELRVPNRIERDEIKRGGGWKGKNYQEFRLFFTNTGNDTS